MIVVYSDDAKQQLNDLALEKAERSGFELRGKQYTQRIIRFCNNLTPFPNRGKPHDDIMPGLRIIGFEKSANIAFTINDDIVAIEAILYRGRNFETHE